MITGAVWALWLTGTTVNVVAYIGLIMLAGIVVNQSIGERRSIHSYGSRSADVSAAFDALWNKLRRLTR